MYSCFAIQKVWKHQARNSLEAVCFVNHRAHQCSSIWWRLNWIIAVAGNEGRCGIGRQEGLWDAAWKAQEWYESVSMEKVWGVVSLGEAVVHWTDQSWRSYGHVGNRQMRLPLLLSHPPKMQLANTAECQSASWWWALQSRSKPARLRWEKVPLQRWIHTCTWAHSSLHSLPMLWPFRPHLGDPPQGISSRVLCI